MIFEIILGVFLVTVTYYLFSTNMRLWSDVYQNIHKNSEKSFVITTNYLLFSISNLKSKYKNEISIGIGGKWFIIYTNIK